jgi:hypothetical protein
VLDEFQRGARLTLKKLGLTWMRCRKSYQIARSRRGCSSRYRRALEIRIIKWELAGAAIKS